MSKDKQIYTVFCSELDGGGTMWIDTVDAVDVDDAIEAAREKCAHAWGYELEAVKVRGVCTGDIKVLHWEDCE